MCFIWLALFVFLQLNLNAFWWGVCFPFGYKLNGSCSLLPSCCVWNIPCVVLEGFRVCDSCPVSWLLHLPGAYMHTHKARGGCVLTRVPVLLELPSILLNTIKESRFGLYWKLGEGGCPLNLEAETWGSSAMAPTCHQRVQLSTGLSLWDSAYGFSALAAVGWGEGDEVSWGMSCRCCPGSLKSSGPWKETVRSVFIGFSENSEFFKFVLVL